MFNNNIHIQISNISFIFFYSGDPPLPKWKQLAQATTTLSQSTMETDGLTSSIPGHVTHTHTPSRVPYSHTASTKTPSSSSTTSLSSTTATTTTTTTTKKPCPEEINRMLT